MIRHRALVVAFGFAFFLASPDSAAPPPLSSADSLASFAVADGYVIELVAAEPLVSDPVAMAWDASGRLFVAEMGDYPLGPAASRIRMLRDTNKDGVMDESVIFADGLPFANGLTPSQGGLLVTSAPSIVMLKDNDGDGKADASKVVLTGFGEGNQQLRVNGLTYGLDNWFYGANGRSDGVIRIAGSNAPGVPLAGRDFRFKDGRFETVAGMAQFGQCFDDAGERFLSFNTIPVRHAVFQDRDLARNPFAPIGVATHPVEDPADANRVFARSSPTTRFNREPVGYFNASCGLTIERGGIFPEKDAGAAFACEPLANVVHRRLLVPLGPTFSGKRAEDDKQSEFVASSDPWFHPVNLASGPDGALYIADFYREWVEHPQFVREDLRGGVNFTKGRGHGRIWRVRPKNKNLLPVADLAALDSAALTRELSHPNAWRRTTAQRLLVERGAKDSVAEVRRQLRESTAPLGRLHALGTLDGLGAAGTAEILLALTDTDFRVRSHAIKLAEPLLPTSSELTSKVAALADDPSARVRFQLARSVSGAKGDAVDKALVRIAIRDSADPWTVAAVKSSFAIAERDRPVTFIRLLAERVAARATTAGELELAEVAALTAAQLADQAVADSAPKTEVKQGTAKAGTPSADPAAANKSDAAPSKDSGLAPLFAWLASPDRRDKPLALAVVLGLSDAKKIPLEKRFGANEKAAWLAAARRQLDQATTAPATAVVAARLLSLDQSAEGRASLAKRLAGEQAAEVRLAAIASLARRQTAEDLDLLLGSWDTASPRERAEVLTGLFRAPAGPIRLLTAIEAKTIPQVDLDLESRRRLLESNDAMIKARAAKLFPARSSADREKVIKAALAAMPPTGDPARGREVFVKNCASCHRCGGVGHRVGPELSGLITKSPPQLLEDILDPSRQALPDYTGFLVATKEGEIKTGLLAGESAAAIVLKRQEGIDEVIRRDEIETFRSTGRTLMPDGFEQTISPAQLADLIAFLRNPVGG